MIEPNYKKMWERLNAQNEAFEKILFKLKGDQNLSVKDIISIDDLSIKDMKLIFRITYPFKEEFIKRPEKKIPLLKGKVAINFFMEASTRTRTSFEIAGKQLNVDTINVSGGSDSTTSKKGETLNDVARTLRRLMADCIILRHAKAGSPSMIAKQVECPIINAGDGCHEHPTQCLLDLYTIYEKKNRIKGLNIVIVGDILHSRVAGSLIRGLKKFGANVRVAGPPTLIPHSLENFGVEVYYDLDEALKDVDVIYALRIQLERAAAAFIPSVREYSKKFVINPDRLKLAKPDAIVMHPGPINREVDLRTEVMEGPQSVVEDQVTNGLAIRMALLFLLIKRPKPMKEKQAQLVPNGG